MMTLCDFSKHDTDDHEVGFRRLHLATLRPTILLILGHTLQICCSHSSSSSSSSSSRHPWPTITLPTSISARRPARACSRHLRLGVWSHVQRYYYNSEQRNHWSPMKRRGILFWSCLLLCMYVCQTITFESIDVESSYLHIPRRISWEYGSSSYMKVIGSRSRSQEQKKSTIPIPLM